eukprot:g48492.t1
MAVRAVAYSSCRKWEIRETSSVPGGYTCEKCTWLQLLIDCFRELDALKIIRGIKNIIDKSYSEVVTPKVQAVGSWVATRRGLTGKVNELRIQMDSGDRDITAIAETRQRIRQDWQLNVPGYRSYRHDRST